MITYTLVVRSTYITKVFGKRGLTRCSKFSASLPDFNKAQEWSILSLEHFIEITVASSHSKHLILRVPCRTGEEIVDEICEIVCQITVHTLLQPVRWMNECLWQSHHNLVSVES